MESSESAAAAPPRRAIVRATIAEAPGAAQKVAGLTVCDRAIKQLGRMGYGVILASDGSGPTPPDVETQTVATEADVSALAQALGGVPVVGADVVRPANRIVEGGLRVVDESTRRRAEDAVFAELLRGDLGLVARHLNKPLSFRITRHWLCRLPVTPNQVTVGAAVIGLVGCALVATGRYGLVVLGLGLAHLQSVLDGCDGELARVRFQQSAIGEWLDTLVDDGLNLALLAAVGVGLARAEGWAMPLWAALLGCAMLLAYNLVTYRELRRQGEGGEVLKVRWWFARGADLKELYADGTSGSAAAFRALVFVGRRDFFVLAWLALAALGQLRLVLFYGLLVALANFGVAVGQLVTRTQVRPAE